MEHKVKTLNRIPGFKSDEIKVLSLSKTKKSVWRVYEAACETLRVQVVGYTKFLKLWEQFYPNVVVTKPMTDLFHLPAEHFEITKSRKPYGEQKVRVCESSPGASKLHSGRKTILQGLMSQLRENSGNNWNQNLSGQWKPRCLLP